MMGRGESPPRKAHSMKVVDVLSPMKDEHAKKAGKLKILREREKKKASEAAESLKSARTLPEEEAPSTGGRAFSKDSTLLAEMVVVRSLVRLQENFPRTRRILAKKAPIGSIRGSVEKDFLASPRPIDRQLSAAFDGGNSSLEGGFEQPSRVSAEQLFYERQKTRGKREQRSKKKKKPYIPEVKMPPVDHLVDLATKRMAKWSANSMDGVQPRQSISSATPTRLLRRRPQGRRRGHDHFAVSLEAAEPIDDTLAWKQGSGRRASSPSAAHLPPSSERSRIVVSHRYALKEREQEDEFFLFSREHTGQSRGGQTRIQSR